MRKATFVLITCFLVQFYNPLQAQTFAVKGGLNLAKMIEKHEHYAVIMFSNDTTEEYSIKSGFHIGFEANIPFYRFLSFEPGIFLTTKGMYYEDENVGVTIQAEANLYYIDVPLTIKATHELENGLKIFGAFGPYFGVGLNGKLKVKTLPQGKGHTSEYDTIWDKKSSERLDMGLIFGAGLEYNSIIFGISYDLGLINIAAFDGFITKSKSRVLKFSLGYRF